MKMFTDRKYLAKEVVVMLIVVMLGIAPISYGAVTIPNTFTAGTPAKASEVNANFQALANVMPAAKTVSIISNVTITAITPAPPNPGDALQSLTVTLPAAGKVMVFASGSICVAGHTSGKWDGVMLTISKTSGDVTSTGFAQAYEIPDNEPTYPVDSVCRPFSFFGVYDEITTGPFTYYLNGIRQSNTATAYISHFTLTALYIPSTLP